MRNKLVRALLVLAVGPSLALTGCGSSGGTGSGETRQQYITNPDANMSTAGSHSGGPVFLRAADGSFITDNTKVYSPERTCGGCHDTTRITAGYHFQQGLAKLTNLADKDGYNTSKPWLLTDGMFGKW
jgi:hypothetical protein